MQGSSAKAGQTGRPRRGRPLLAGPVPLVLGALMALGARSGIGVGSPAPPRAARATLAATVVRLDGRRLGPSFQGIGAISGGGGNSRLLIDYPAAERSAILDLLFRPGVGASLQLLKLEIGGGGNSSDGAEPSVEPVRGHVDCQVGYELWLARQAVRRNPHLALYGLQWSAPAWVRGKNGSLWTSADIAYLLDWLGCTRRAGLHVGYVGGWNEHYTPGSAAIARWYVDLRRALDRHGYASVKIVAADNVSLSGSAVWSVATDMTRDPAFGRAVAVIGVHDICGLESHAFTCTGSPVARAWARSGHKWLWQSELGRTPRVGSGPLEEGPASLARALNLSFVDAGVTGTLLWPLVESMPPGMPFGGRGLVAADQPWSGRFTTSTLLWVVAQTTQFSQPGWRFVGGGAGRLAGGGSYVAYAAPSRRAWSLVVETSVATAPQLVRLRLQALPTKRLRVWRTGLQGGRQLEALAPVAVAGGAATYRLAPHAVYTFTTIARPSARDARSARRLAGRRSRALPVRYTARRDAAGMARLLAPVEGSFQYEGGVLTQANVGRPVAWSSCDVGFPYAVLGDGSWRRYTIAATADLPPANGPGAGSGTRGARPGAFLLAGYSGLGEPCDFSGYLFSVDDTGRWRLTRNADLGAAIASGRVAPATRYRLALSVGPHLLVGSLGGRRVVTYRVARSIAGLAGIGSLTFQTVRYEAVTVR